MEFYESTYFVVLIPSIVITVIFLFFWLFMKETLYDEVLAKQKREQKLISTKTDKKKSEKKKNKKKEIQNGAIHESDSENVLRDLKLPDASAGEEEQFVTAPLNVLDTSSSVRERKKKDKKQKPPLEEQIIRESDASKTPGKKVEPVLVTKQPAPPPEAAALKKKAGQKKSKNGSVLVDEPLIHASSYIPPMDNANSNLVVDKREIIDVIKPDHVEGIHKSGAKKLKIETDKENAEVKFKDFLLSLKTMMFSEDEAVCVVDLLKEKSGAIKDALKKSSKGELSALLHQLQEKERLLAAVKEDAAVTKERCKQLTQEMMAEKERSNVVIARMKDRIGALEKEHNIFQKKMHVSYQETQQMQIKFQQVREQMEAEIAHLKQENGILRDAVSNTTNQLESKSNYKKLRGGGKKFRATSGREQQSMRLHNKDILEQNEALKAQIQQFHSQIAAQTSASVLAEELHKVIAEKDKQLKQTEDSLANEHDHLASKEEELKDIQNMNFLLKAEVQKLQALANEQAAAVHEVEKMQKSIHVKDDKIRLLEEQLQHEIASKMEEFKILSDQNKALQLEVQNLQIVVSQQPNKDIMEQMEKCIQEKDEKLKTVEELLETGLIQVATKEEELNVKHFLDCFPCVYSAIRTENSTLTKEVQELKAKQSDQVSFVSLVEELRRVIHEKDGQIKSVEELLEVELLKVANKEKTVQLSVTSQVQELQNLLRGKEEQVNTMKVALEDKDKDLTDRAKRIQDLQEENASLKAYLQEAAQPALPEACSTPRFEELENMLKEKENEIRRIEAILKDTESHLSNKSKMLQEVEDENKLFKSQIEQLNQQNHQQASFPSQEELQTIISEKEKELTDLRSELDSLKNAVEHQRKKNNDLREKNWEAMEALASTEKMLQDKVNKTSKERQQHVEAVELEAKELLKRLFPMVSVPTNLTYSEWLRGFEKKAKACVAGTSDAEAVKVLEHRLKEADEMHALLQLECEKYKSVLAETEGILQKLQRSVEQEESKWKIKADESRRTIKQMQASFTSSEQELEQLRRENRDIENLRREREHLEMELEKAEVERSTYVTEVRELKTQLNETRTKLQNEQSERKKVADDLHKAQQSLNFIHSKIALKAAGDNAVIGNSSVSPETGAPEKETMSVSLNQTVVQLQQLLQEVNQQLMKEK
ncbi:kinectin [Cricetulus griseus]|nr:kinectin [Cricetulus griseus]